MLLHKVTNIKRCQKKKVELLILSIHKFYNIYIVKIEEKIFLKT